MDFSSPLIWLLAIPLSLAIALTVGAFILQAACALVAWRAGCVNTPVLFTAVLKHPARQTTDP